jgi:hypothetical protein
MPITLSVLLLCLIVWLLAVMYAHLNMVDYPSRPQGLELVQIRSNIAMADVLTYRVSAAAPVDADVVSRVVTLKINGEDKGARTFEGAVTDLGTVTAPQDAEVELSLVDVDDAGNMSQPATYTFTAVDTLPPAVPGAFNVTLVSEAPEEPAV